jgi:hypothetical protein
MFCHGTEAHRAAISGVSRATASPMTVSFGATA